MNEPIGDEHRCPRCGAGPKYINLGMECSRCGWEDGPDVLGVIISVAAVTIVTVAVVYSLGFGIGWW